MAPKRKGKKGTLHYALEVCDRGQLTTLVSTKGDLDGKAGMEVLNCIRRSREVFRDNISPLQGAISLGHYNICKHLVEEGAMMKSACTVPHPLCLAFQKGHFEIAHLLIKAGADVNLAFEETLPLGFALEEKKCTLGIVKEIIAKGFPHNGVVHRPSLRTALHSAAKNNHYQIAKYLLTLSINVNVKDLRGLTPLHYAVQRGFPLMVKLLATNGANLDSECLENFTPMFYAIAMGDYDMVKLLLSLGADIHFVSSSRKCSMMPLHFAANFCQFKIAQLLLEKGAEVNRTVPMTGEIALHSAARADVANSVPNKVALDCIVELLIKQGSNVKARHKYGFTPLQVSIKAKNVSVAKILIIHGAEINNTIQEGDAKVYSTFHMAAKLLDRDLLKLCLDYGGDCNYCDEEGLYPTHLGLLTAMLDLITHNADCNQSLNSQRQNEQLTIFKMFWKHNFPFDLTLKMKWLDNETPPIPTKIASSVQKQKMLFTGLKSQQLRVVQKAIAQGAEVKCCSTDIPFPLHYIASRGNDSIMKIFLSKGVTVNCVDKRGETPLHVAAKAGFVNCCRLLLEYGAAYNYCSEKCPKTPLQLAKDNNHSEIVTLLATVNKYFKNIKKGRFKRLKPDMKIFCSVMNCCNADGVTLLSRAIQLNMKDSADRLMKLRSHMIA